MYKLRTLSSKTRDAVEVTGRTRLAAARKMYGRDVQLQADSGVKDRYMVLVKDRTQPSAWHVVATVNISESRA